MRAGREGVNDYSAWHGVRSCPMWKLRRGSIHHSFLTINIFKLPPDSKVVTNEHMIAVQ
jgi:hypothetical protein